MSYAIVYFRDRNTVARLKAHGIDRPVGFVTGRDRFRTEEEALKLAQHINRQNPVEPVTVTRSHDVYNCDKFLHPDEALALKLSGMPRLRSA